MTIPRIDGAYSAEWTEWTEWTWDSILVEDANCREVIDNVVDMAHFFYIHFYIHFAFPTFFKNVFEGHIASQYLRTRSRPDVDGASNYSSGEQTTLRSEASYFGPSYMIGQPVARLPAAPLVRAVLPRRGPGRGGVWGGVPSGQQGNAG